MRFHKNVWSFLVVLCSAAIIGHVGSVEVGDSIPNVNLHLGFPPLPVNLKQRVAGKKVILVGLPGAFTPTCSTRQIPGYLDKVDAIKEVGVDEVIIYSVNDGAGK
jgi:peroxiredoxin